MRDPEVKKIYDELVVNYKKTTETLPLVAKIGQLQMCLLSGYRHSTGFSSQSDDCPSVLAELEGDSDSDISSFAKKVKEFREQYKEFMLSRSSGRGRSIAPLPRAPQMPNSIKEKAEALSSDTKKMAEKEKELIEILRKKSA